MAGEKAPVLNRDTLIPIGVAIAIAAPIGIGISWLRDGQRDNSFAIEKLRNEMVTRFDTLEMQSQDRWTLWQMRLWTTALQRDNPQIKVPEVQR